MTGDRPTMTVRWVYSDRHTTTPECVPACVDAILERDVHDDACQWSSGPQLGTAWCPRCSRTVEIADQFTAGNMTVRGEEEYGVTALTCGHDTQGPARIVAAAPGALYAGPGVAVAATHRPRDLRVAQQRQRQLDRDPWESAE